MKTRVLMGKKNRFEFGVFAWAKENNLKWNTTDNQLENIFRNNFCLWGVEYI